MTKKLHPLPYTRLSQPDLAQFVVRSLDDVEKSGIRYNTDESLVALVTQLKAHNATFQKSLEQVRASDKTVALAKGDKLRDDAFKAFGTSLKAYRSSNLTDEQTAYNSLNLLYRQFKDSSGRNYEAQTVLVNNLLSKLATAPYKEQVTLLGLKRFVDRLSQANRDFDSLYASRSQDRLTQVAYNSKELRTQVIHTYSLLADYINIMAQVKKTRPYTDLLPVINHSRKTYADRLGRGKSKKNKD